MSNNKQSSVEWLYEELLAQFYLQIDSLMSEEIKGKIEQAKEKHGNEVRDAFYIGRYEYNNFDSNSTQYYNETFGGNNG